MNYQDQMNSFDQTLQALKQYSLPICSKENHIDNLIIIRNDQDNNCLEAYCGECDKFNTYENEKISTKYMLRLIIEEIYSRKQYDYNNKFESKLAKIDSLIKLLKDNQNYISQELDNLKNLKSEIIKYQNQESIISSIKEIISAILQKNCEHEQFQQNIMKLSKLIKLDSRKGNQKIELNFEPYKFDFSSFDFINSQLSEIKYKLSRLQTQFDTDYSSRFYTFDKGNNTAIFKRNSKDFPNIYSQIKNYYEWPVLRINKLITSGIYKIRFKMNQKGYFGLGTPELPSNGFPGYTQFGYVHQCNGDDSWYNDRQYKSADDLLTNGENIVDKIVEFTVDADNRECWVSYDGKVVRRNYPLQNPVYIVFALFKGTLDLIK